MGEHFFTYPTVIEFRAEPDPRPGLRGGAVDPPSRPPMPDRAGLAGLTPQGRDDKRADW